MAESIPSVELMPYYMNFKEQYVYSMGEYAAFVHERMPDLDLGLTEDNLPERLERVFRQSFPQSNGIPLIQFLLQATAIRLMAVELGSSEPIVEAIDAIQIDPTVFYPPKNHVRFKPERLDKRIQQIWDIYVDIAHNTDSMHDLRRTDEMPDGEWDKLAVYSETGMQNFLLAALTCEADYKWIERGRPYRRQDKARFQSFFRTYIFGQQPTGSQELDVVNALTRETVAYMIDQDNLAPDQYTQRRFLLFYTLVAQRWGEIHGRQFAPPDIDQHFGKPLIPQAIEGENWQFGADSFR